MSGDGPTLERLETRLRRLEQQIRSFKDLHSSEMALILEELRDIASELDTAHAAAAKAADEAPAADPSAGSPKRAAWLEQQKRPLSRRDLLRGREET
jgi:hypothetical protein